MKPAAYMIWAPFTGPARFTTDHSAPEKTAQRADYTCTPLVTEHDAIAAIEQARREEREVWNTWANAVIRDLELRARLHGDDTLEISQGRLVELDAIRAREEGE